MKEVKCTEAYMPLTLLYTVLVKCHTDNFTCQWGSCCIQFNGLSNGCNCILPPPHINIHHSTMYLCVPLKQWHIARISSQGTWAQENPGGGQTYFGIKFSIRLAVSQGGKQSHQGGAGPRPLPLATPLH